ncbi:MAG: SUMF1/EgtB/PvdO family nonheme iron enzyme [Saprospirales bacterium]|nr:SUMF1/EgtB/PvdO family nonheme iron enzyme [Saprospirales bacterium]
MIMKSRFIKSPFLHWEISGHAGLVESGDGEGKNPSGFKGDNDRWKVFPGMTQRIFKKIKPTNGPNFSASYGSGMGICGQWRQTQPGVSLCGSDKLKQVGWFTENSGEQIQDVGMLLANELGLHDMSGNVYEWCEDDWHNIYYDAPIDGSAWIYSRKRALAVYFRGGSFLASCSIAVPRIASKTPDRLASALAFAWSCHSSQPLKNHPALLKSKTS